MWQIQIFLPIYMDSCEPFPDEFFGEIKTELTDKFGGLTMYTRAPAKGLWKGDEGKVVKDDIAIYEVMAHEIDRGWWKGCRVKLEKQFEQAEIIIRAWQIESL